MNIFSVLVDIALIIIIMRNVFTVGDILADISSKTKELEYKILILENKTKDLVSDEE